MKMIDTPEQMTMVEDALTDRQLTALRDMMYFYKEFQEELYNYPDSNTLFTQTQRELFTIFDIK